MELAVLIAHMEAVLFPRDGHHLLAEGQGQQGCEEENALHW